MHKAPTNLVDPKRKKNGNFIAWSQLKEPITSVKNLFVYFDEFRITFLLYNKLIQAEINST